MKEKISKLHKSLYFSALLSLSVFTYPAKSETINKFTIAVIPDTQNYLSYKHQKAEKFPFDARDMFYEQMHFVAENTGGKGENIVFVSALGDVWQHQSLPIDPEHEARGFSRVANPVFDTYLPVTEKVKTIEMPAAREGYALIAGKVPFSVVPGNHDYDAMWTDARFPPADKIDRKDLSTLGMLHPGGLSNFRSIFGDQSVFFKDKPWYVASHDGGADSAQIFTAGGYRFLHIGLQFDPTDASLEWAETVIARYPGLPTIVTTHDYMNKNGQRIPNPLIDGNAVDPEHNSPQMVWDKFISQHDQIFMVLCGHQHGQAMRVDDNVHGHSVYQILSDYQHRGQTAIDAAVQSEPPVPIGDGWMRLMTFDMSQAQPVINVRTYSTHYRKTSKATTSYVKWYRAQEHPDLSDEAFHAQDDFQITLTDFRKRFGAGTTAEPVQSIGITTSAPAADDLATAN